MRRRTALGLGVVLTIVSACGLFQVKHHVQQLRNDLGNLTQQLNYEKETLHVLKAEWTYLNQPERLHALVSKHLRLESMRISQVIRDGATENKVFVRHEKTTHPHAAITPVSHQLSKDSVATNIVPVTLLR